MKAILNAACKKYIILSSLLALLILLSYSCFTSAKASDISSTVRSAGYKSITEVTITSGLMQTNQNTGASQPADSKQNTDTDDSKAHNTVRLPLPDPNVRIKPQLLPPADSNSPAKGKFIE